jgi:site-specific recombinase XerD
MDTCVCHLANFLISPFFKNGIPMTKATSNYTDKQSLRARFDSYYQHVQLQKTDPVTLYLQGLAPSGRRAVKSLLTSAVPILGFTGTLETIPWSVVEYQQVALVRNTLKQRGKATNTINLTLAALRGVMKASFNLGLIGADQLLLINDLRPVRGQSLPSGRSLSVCEIEKLLRTCFKDKTVVGVRDHAVISLMTGLRRSEIIAIQLDDINFRTGLLNIASGKGNKQRATFINAECRAVLSHWRKKRGNHAGTLFNPVSKTGTILNKPLTGQSIHDIVGLRATQAKLGHVRPHDLRRTFVTRLLEAGVDINTTRQLAGHSDIQTTARYDFRDSKVQKRAIQQLFK